MSPDSQVLLSIGIPTVAVLVGILLNSRQIESLRSEIGARFETVNTRIDALHSEMNARFETAHQALLRVEGVMDARLKHFEED